MKNPCHRYETSVTLTVTTQFPQSDKESLSHLVRAMMGPWCKSAVVHDCIDAETGIAVSQAGDVIQGGE